MRICVAILLLLVCPCLAASRDLVMAVGDPEDSEMGLLSIAFKDYVSRKSAGSLNVRLVYSGGLDADETFQFHRCQTGKLALALGGVGNLAPMVPALGIVTLPYIFPDEKAAVTGTSGKAAELLNSYAEHAGLRILAWTYYGYRFLSNSRHAIKRLDDLKGLQIRVPQSMVMIRAYRALGAIPVPIAWPATAAALKNGLADGQCYDYNGFRAMKFREAGQRFISETHFIYNLQPLVINLRLFQSLPGQDQEILLEAGAYIQKLSLQYQQEMNAIAKKALLADGVEIDQLEDEGEWRKAAVNRVWTEACDHVGGAAALNGYLKASGLPAWHPGTEEE